MASNLPPASAIGARAFVERREPGCWLLRDARMPLVAFSTRLGGVSDGSYSSLNLGLSTGDRPDRVRENRRLLTRALGLEEVARVRQVHGSILRTAVAGGPAGDGDVLATTRADLALAVSTADCLGVVLWDEARTALAVAHAGWRGVLAGAVEAALDWLARECSGSPIRAALGPALRVCCFEVGRDVAERFPRECIRDTTPRPRLDLVRAVGERLAARGVTPAAVSDLGLCTSCTPALFYSHRRDRGTTGRHWALARLAPRG